MRAHSLPDVQRVDLCGPALSVRAFAGRAPAVFGWFEAPPADALRRADELLVMLGAISAGDGALTARGRDLLSMPLHPRLGATVIAGRERGCAAAAATAAVLLSDVDGLGRDRAGADLHAAVEAFLLAEERGFPEHLCREFGAFPGAARGLRQTRDRMMRRGERDQPSQRETSELSRCLLRGFPDRVVRRTPGAAADVRTGTMVGGRGVTLPTVCDGEELVLALRLHCLLYTSPSPRDQRGSRMPSSA